MFIHGHGMDEATAEKLNAKREASLTVLTVSDRRQSLSAWKIARIILIVAGFISGIFQGLYDPGRIYQVFCHEFGVVGIAFLILFPVVFFPPASLLVIGVQSINPYSAVRWTKPSWDSNFLNPRDPMHFVHLGAFMALAVAAGLIICSPFVGLWVFLEGVSCLASSAGLFLGIRLCMKVFARKFEAGT
jgi:hypothetical protein